MADKLWQHKEILKNMYEEQGLTVRAIAQILSTSPANISYWMKKFKIDGKNYDIGELNKGKVLTEEEKQHLSEVAKERFKESENHPMFGHKHTEISKKKMSETKKKKKQENRRETCEMDG